MRLITLLAFGLLAVTPSAFADAIAVDGGWYGFCYGGPGSGVTAGCTNSGTGSAGNPITFTLAGPGTFRITDAFWAGDTFDVYVNDVLLLQTPTVPNDILATQDPDLAFADPRYSSGSLRLGPGAYSVRVFLRDSPFGNGAGYLSVVSTQAVGVPEPSAIAGFLAVGALGLTVRRRKI